MLETIFTGARRSGLRLAGAALVTVLVIAATWWALRGREARRLAVVSRVVADLPVELFVPGSVFGSRAVRTIDLAVEPPPPGENPPVVLLPGPFVATEFDELTVDVAAMVRGQMVATWEGADETGPVAGRIMRQAEHATRLADGTLRFSFPLADAAAWRGRIDRLTVHTGARHRAVIRPRRAELARREASPKALEAALLKPWLVEVEGDRRPALLLSPGRTLRWALPDAGASRLAFSLALCPANRHAVAVRILARPTTGVTREIWRKNFASGEPSWREVQLDLGSELAGGAALEVEVDGLAGELVYLGDPAFLAPARRRSNLVLISIDTLRADHLSLYGYSRRTSPLLDAWSAQATVFRRAVASATTTLPSHTSIFTGIDAIRHGVHGVPVSPLLTSLAAHLRASGWRTVARTAGGFLHPNYGLNRGFERFSFHRPGVDQDGELETGMAIVYRWLEDLRDEPFFLLLHTYEVHGPYRPRMPYLAEIAPGVTPPGLAWPSAEVNSVETGYRLKREGSYIFRGEDPNGPNLGPASAAEAVALYDSSIGYVDAEIGGLFAELRRLGLAEDTVIVVTSDHGEAFGEHGEAGHGYLHDNNVIVPLIIYAPGKYAGREVLQQVRSVDIAPTVLDLLDAPPLAGIDGVSLRPAMAGSAVHELPGAAITSATHTGYGLALRTDDRLELLLSNGVWPPYRRATSLFDLRADPGETRDLHAEHPRTGELARRLLAGWAQVAPGLHLSIEVPGGAPVSLTVTHPELTPLRVGVIEFEGTAAWENELRLDLPAGSRSQLVLDLRPGVVSVRAAGEARHLVGERGTQIVGGARLVWEWRVLEGWRATASPAEDDLLLEQLRALGYAN